MSDTPNPLPAAEAIRWFDINAPEMNAKLTELLTELYQRTTERTSPTIMKVVPLNDGRKLRLFGSVK